MLHPTLEKINRVIDSLCFSPNIFQRIAGREYLFCNLWHEDERKKHTEMCDIVVKEIEVYHNDFGCNVIFNDAYVAETSEEVLFERLFRLKLKK